MKMELNAGVNYTIRKKSVWKSKLLPWMLLFPTLLLLSLVIIGPLLGVFVFSLTDWDGLRSPTFIGLGNYAALFHDEVFTAALLNNVKWILFFLTIPAIFSLLVALWISRITRGQMLYRSLIFIPYIVSTIVTAKIWLLIYNPFFGINVKLKEWGLDFLAKSWVGDAKIALFSVAMADAWHFWGFLVVLFLVALQQMDRSIEEAATVDGASKLRIFWHVTLPQLRPTLVMNYMLLIIWSFAAFDYVYVMTNGGPGRATELLATHMYKLSIYSQQSGYASAIAMTMGVFSLIVIMGFGFIKKKGWDV